MEIGDLVIGEMMGAYTAATATDFNSLNKAKIIALNKTQEETSFVLKQNQVYSDKLIKINSHVKILVN